MISFCYSQVGALLIDGMYPGESMYPLIDSMYEQLIVKSAASL